MRFKDYFKRPISFYLGLAAIVLFTICTVVYSVSSSISEHPDYNLQLSILIISVITIIFSLGCTFFDVATPFSSPILFLGQFVTFLILVDTTYIYLSDKFFGVSSVEMFLGGIANLDKGYLISLILYVVVFALSTVSIFMTRVQGNATATKQKFNILKHNNIIHLVAKISVYVFVFASGLLLAGGDIAFANATAINSEFGIQTQFKIDLKTDETKPHEPIYKTQYGTFKEMLNGGFKAAQEAVEEGAVLLKNENNALPLKKDAKVSLFSSSCVYPAYSGIGSGANIDAIVPGNTEFRDEFEEAGMSVNPRFITVRPAWQKAIDVGRIVSYSVLGVSFVALAFEVALQLKEKLKIAA